MPGDKTYLSDSVTLQTWHCKGNRGALRFRLPDRKFFNRLSDGSTVELGGDGDGVLFLVAEDVVESNLVPEGRYWLLHFHGDGLKGISAVC